jgi:hypothetical protein
LSLEGPAPKSGYSITGKQEGKFAISLYEPASDDLTFTYWIVNTYAAEGTLKENTDEVSPEPSVQKEASAAKQPVHMDVSPVAASSTRASL